MKVLIISLAFFGFTLSQGKVTEKHMRKRAERQLSVEKYYKIIQLSLSFADVPDPLDT